MTEDLNRQVGDLWRKEVEDRKRLNQLLCERDPMRSTRFYDVKAKLEYELAMERYHLENVLKLQVAPIQKKITGLQAQIQQLIYNHENFLDGKDSLPEVQPPKEAV